ncbi:MAG: hypothetical protein ABSE39_10000 [Candidatus Bathyarchaeia archaeon]|jgi:hypothetical protein
MEPAPVLMPAPAIVEDRSKPVVIRPPEVNGAHDYAIIGFVLVFLYVLPWFIIVLTIGALGLLASPYIPSSVILPPVLPAWLAGIPLIGTLLSILTFPGVGLPPVWFAYLGFGVIGLLAAIIFLAILYFSTVRNISRGRYERARGAALFFAVLFTIPVFLVLVAPLSFFPTVLLLLPAFFFYMTYGRLGEVIAKYGPVAVLGEAVPGAAMAGPPPPPPPMAFAGPPGAPMPPMGGPMMGGPPMGGPMPGGPMGQFPPGQMGMPAPSAPAPAPKTPLCPTCGRDLYYSANHRRWYCQTCDNPSSH